MSTCGSSSRYNPYLDRKDRLGHDRGDRGHDRGDRGHDRGDRGNDRGDRGHDRDKRHRPSHSSHLSHSSKPSTIASSIYKPQSPRSSTRSSASESSDGPLLKKIKVEKPDEPEFKKEIKPKNTKQSPKVCSAKNVTKNIAPVVLAFSDKSVPLLELIKTSYEKQLKDVSKLKDGVSEQVTAMETQLKDNYNKIVDEIQTQQIAASMQRNEVQRRKKKKMLKLKAARHQKQRAKRKLKRQKTCLLRKSIGESPY